MMKRQDHPLFRRFPLATQTASDGTTYPMPYHIYDGAIGFIGGTADLSTAHRLLQGERLAPYHNDAGRALVGVWVCDFTEASLGAHHELQISIFAAFQPQPPVKTHPFAVTRLLSADPNAIMLCHGLWNDTPNVVAYNRDLLGLEARRSISRIETGEGRRRFQVQDAESGQPVAEGDLLEPGRQQPGVMWQMMAHIGLRGMLRVARSPFIQVPVVNPINPRLPENRIARTCTKNDRQIVRCFDPGADRLRISHPQYAALDFRPEFVQHGFGVRFVYLNPEPVSPA